MSKSDVRKNVKRLFAMFLALAMVATLLPAAVMAEGETELTNDDPAQAEAASVPLVEETQEPDGTEEPAADVTEAAEMFAATDAAVNTAADEGDDLFTAAATVGEDGNLKDFTPNGAGILGNVALDLDTTIDNIKAEAPNMKIGRYEYTETNSSSGHKYQLFLIGETVPAIDFAFTSAEEGEADTIGYYVRDKVTPTTWNKANVGTDGKVTGLKNGDLIAFYKDESNYAVAMIIRSAMISLTVDDGEDGASTGDKLSFTHESLFDLIGETAGTTYTILGAADQEETTEATWFDSIVFDTVADGANKSGEANYNGDVVTFEVTPGTDRYATVTVDGKPATSPSTDGKYAVTLTDSKVYNVVITYAEDTFELESAAPADSEDYARKDGPYIEEDHYTDYEVYYTGEKVILTFAGNLGTSAPTVSDSGTLTAVEGAKGKYEFTPTDNTVYTFTRGGDGTEASFKMAFYKTAPVYLTVKGPEGSGSVNTKVNKSANGNHAGFSGAENVGIDTNAAPDRTEPQIGELFDIAGRADQLGAIDGGQEDDKGDEIQFTVKPAEGNMLMSFMVNDVDKKDDLANNVYTMTTDDAVITNIVVTFGKLITVTGVTVSGGNRVGDTLTATHTPADATVSHQWYRDDDADTNTTGTAIPSATAATYTLVDADAGKYVYVIATGLNDSKATSNATHVRLPTFTLSNFSGTTDTTQHKIDAAEVETIGAELDVYYLNNTDVVKLTFAGEAEGTITGTKSTDGTATITNTDSENTDTVTVSGYSDKEIVTFTRQGATYRVRFYQVAKVNLSIAEGTEAMGTVGYAFDPVANPDNKKTGTLNATTAAHTELLDDGDKVTLTITPKDGYEFAVAGTTLDASNAFTVTKGQTCNIVVTFAAAPPDVEPGDEEGKDGNADSAFEPSTAMNAAGNAQIVAAATAKDVAYELHYAGDQTSFVIPGITGTVKYKVVTNTSTWGEEKTYAGKIDGLKNNDVLLIYTDYNNWFKIRLVQSALVAVDVTKRAGIEDAVSVTYPGAEDPVDWSAPTSTWLKYGTGGESVTVTAAPAESGQAKFSLDGTVIVDAQITDNTYTVTPDASKVYKLAVFFVAGEITEDSTDIQGNQLVSEDVAIDGAAITGDVNILIPADATLTITEGVVSKGLTVSGGGEVKATTVKPDAGLSVDVVGSKLDVGTLTVGSGSSLKVEADGGAITVSTELSLDSGADSTVANGGTLTIAENATLNVKSTALSVENGGTLAINNTATIGAGATLNVQNGGQMTLAAGKKIEVAESGELNLDSAAKIELGAGSEIDVKMGTLTIGADANLTTAAGGQATIKIGGDKVQPPARTMLGTMAVDAGEATKGEATASMVIKKDGFEIDSALGLSIGETGALIIEEGCEVTLKATLVNEGYIILMPSAELKNASTFLDNAALQRIIDQFGNQVIPEDGNYVARMAVVANIGAKTGTGFGNSRELEFTGLREGDYIVHQTTAKVTSTEVDAIFISAQRVTQTPNGIFILPIDYNGDSAEILVLVYSKEPDHTNGIALGASTLARNEDGSSETN